MHRRSVRGRGRRRMTGETPKKRPHRRTGRKTGPPAYRPTEQERRCVATMGARAENQGFKINIEKSFDPTAGQVDVYPQEITRALLNVISNGFYAATKRKEHDNSD